MSVNGSCACGGVKFILKGDLRDVVLCHCSQCRKTSGHYWAATQVDNDGLIFLIETTLKWYRSLDIARRGFCSGCGGSLFYERFGDWRIAVAAGTVDWPLDLKIMRNIYVASKGDYYSIADDVLQFEEYWQSYWSTQNYLNMENYEHGWFYKEFHYPLCHLSQNYRI